MKDIGGMQIIIFVAAQQLAVERSRLEPAICFFSAPVNAYFSFKLQNICGIFNDTRFHFAAFLMMKVCKKKKKTVKRAPSEQQSVVCSKCGRTSGVSFLLGNVCAAATRGHAVAVTLTMDSLSPKVFDPQSATLRQGLTKMSILL